MPEIITDFMTFDECDNQTSVILGSDQDNSKLSDLNEGQPVLLVYPHNLKAAATIHIVEDQGKRYYYGILRGEIVAID